MIKPFSFSELLARIQALIRRNRKDTEPTTLNYGNLRMDLLRRTVHRDGEKIDLPAKEYSLLEYLMRNSDRAVSREELLRHVWGVYSNSSSNRLEVYVRYLREKIDRPFGSKYINTVRGVGYRLAA